jgi:hypothetical protein
MIEPVFEREVHDHARAILAAIDRMPGDRSFEALDLILQGLLMAAAQVQLEILELPAGDLAVFRLTTAAYGQMTCISASMLEERAHWKALAALNPDGNIPAPEDT